ncbi:cysteine--1-D-myo-inosityl 2-amino-2-deoxy-alpha-D-glucopyranoside ligase [Carbonactinospora thermoautotrophica]|uniref:cysteine--1-D-myo-inosityl 2-amino-2-deoxy-alpha-D-glucopyranoside ligase n=1 Tax=Carbonactinospora thermoautotrophica TaxID=1469144 RepID=UPI0022721996|nr:cysteine--1-D-myo-inosityl 2-amino-2-deoxy-alpha-D-glucopyranoside ligase [Carbonactinospora thermoautotrophica]MCX9192112.1 cysteine--1-D-myo-inosityl 2-amino-2-deoxy-alpha-D-glucopyranoside ligase [Carbonactinospora thermoautotrophica]
MHAWPAPEVPRLPGKGLPLKVHDTVTGQVRHAAEDRTARLYVCGITPYDATHLGHAATYLAFDLMQRVWLDAGHDVRYVQNVTDVDDPLLERAAQTGEDWRELADREIALFREDMVALRLLPPSVYMTVVEAIPLVIRMIEVLRAKGAAYEVDGDVYFSVGSDPRFGEVSGLGQQEMLRLFAERGGDPDRPGKKHPLDPLLWLAQRPGEPGWDSPFGRGRPGWHIECAAIALEHLGFGFDVQGGGSDLVFPHHEMGASHAHVTTGRHPFARLYVHAGMVALHGKKMSKSKGNLVFVSRLRGQGADPMAIRLALLAHHYRSDWEWTPADLDAGATRLARWRAAVSHPDGPPAEPLLDELRRALADDLDAPAALAAMDRWVAEQEERGGTDPGAPGLAARAVDALLGVAL